MGRIFIALRSVVFHRVLLGPNGPTTWVRRWKSGTQGQNTRNIIVLLTLFRKCIGQTRSYRERRSALVQAHTCKPRANPGPARDTHVMQCARCMQVIHVLGHFLCPVTRCPGLAVQSRRNTECRRKASSRARPHNLSCVYDAACLIRAKVLVSVWCNFACVFGAWRASTGCL